MLTPIKFNTPIIICVDSQGVPYSHESANHGELFCVILVQVLLNVVLIEQRRVLCTGRYTLTYGFALSCDVLHLINLAEFWFILIFQCHKFVLLCSFCKAIYSYGAWQGK